MTVNTTAMRQLRRDAHATRRLLRLPTFNRWADDWLKHWRGRQRSNAQSRTYASGVQTPDGEQR